MAEPVVASIATANSGGSAVSRQAVTRASGLVEGILEVIVVTNDDTADGDEFDSTTNNVRDNADDSSAGYTFINEAGNSTSDAHVAAFYKKLSAADLTRDIYVQAASADNMTVYSLRITGADADDPKDVIGTDEINGSNTNHAWTNTITTTVAECLALHVSSFDGGDTFPFTLDASSITAGWSITSSQQCTSGGDTNASMIAQLDQASAGAVPQLDANASVADGAAGFFFAIKPLSNANVETTTAELTLMTNTATVSTPSELPLIPQNFTFNTNQAIITGDSVIPDGMQGIELGVIASDSILFGLYDLGDFWITPPTTTPGGYPIVLRDDGHFTVDAGGDLERQLFSHQIFDVSADAYDTGGIVYVNNTAPRLTSGNANIFAEDAQVFKLNELVNIDLIALGLDIEGDSFTATLTAGNFVAGWTLTGGVISGAATTDGVYNFSITYTDTPGDTTVFEESVTVISEVVERYIDRQMQQLKPPRRSRGLPTVFGGRKPWL